jgi:DNA (cytosine-5)-methyltransferase 1
MNRKPRALDLFCGAGGATKGLQMAGFHVTGIDIKPQPRYCGDAFIQADALRPPVRLKDFDLVWASPPCQFATQMSARWRGKGGKADSHPNHLPATRELLRSAQLWVIENVVGARKHMRVSFTLHGGQFGLGVHRPRLFESNFFVMVPRARSTVDPIGVYGPRADGRRLFTRKSMDGKVSIQRAAHSAAEACVAMGTHDMDWDGVREAIPPAYAKHIGDYAMMALGCPVGRYEEGK